MHLAYYAPPNITQLYLANHFPPLTSILLLCRYGTQSLVTLMNIIGRTISTDLQITEVSTVGILNYNGNLETIVHVIGSC